MTDKEWKEADAVWTSGDASWAQPVSEPCPDCVYAQEAEQREDVMCDACGWAASARKTETLAQPVSEPTKDKP
jgi:hypothetical protein